MITFVVLHCGILRVIVQIFQGRSSTLTRLGLDDKWEKEKWDKAWEVNGDEINIPGGRDILESKKNKTTFGGDDKLNSKRRKLDNIEGEVWGEAVGPEVVAINKQYQIRPTKTG